MAETNSLAEFPQTGWVVDALQAAWSAVTRAEQSGPGHLKESLEIAVRGGCDTDTLAAIAGGLHAMLFQSSADESEAYERLIAFTTRRNKAVKADTGKGAADLATLILKKRFFSLVTSANLSEAAAHRNLEMGLLVRAWGLRYRVNSRPLPELRRTADIVFTR